MINEHEIIETMQMFNSQHLDIRTITMGISLMDCAAPTVEESCNRIYDKICKYAGKLVETGELISKKYGIPIIHKRISVTPISIVAAACGASDYTPFAQVLDKAARTCGVNFIGGFSALVQKGYTNSDKVLINSIPEALASTEFVCSSINLASTRTGINMDAVRDMGVIIKKTAEATKDKGALGCGEPECVINVGISGPGVVKHALEGVKGKDLGVVAETIKKAAFKITRVGELVAREASERLKVPFGIIDLSLAPTPAVGDSVARLLEEFGLETCGTWGTTAALAMLNDAVKKGGIMASSYVGGLSGAFIPVSEDEGMIAAARSGSLKLEKLEAMTCVCSVGLDMIAIPGDTSAETISGIIADEMALGTFNNKTTAVRLIPVPGKTVGDSVEFGGLLGTAPIMDVNRASCADFIHRGGRIPAPIHSMRN